MRLSFIAALFIVALPTAGIADITAQSILETMRQKQQQRWAGVSSPPSYVVDQTNADRAVLFYEKVSNEVGFRMVPPSEIQQRIETKMGLSVYHKRLLAAGMSGGIMLGGIALQKNLPLTEFSGKLINSGVIAIDSFLMEATSAGEHARETRADAIDAAADMAEFEKVATFGGVQSLDGKEAFLLVANDLNRTQRTEDGEFTLNTVNMWVDTKTHVMLGLRMEGVMKSGKEARNVTILRRDYNHRQVGSLYEPHRQTVAISGILDKKQRKDMEKQMKEFEKSKSEFEAFKAQLASMPQAQRDMMMGSMGAQIAMLENMESNMAILEGLAKNNEIAVETVVHEIRIGGIDAYVSMLANALGMKP